MHWVFKVLGYVHTNPSRLKPNILFYTKRPSVHTKPEWFRAPSRLIKDEALKSLTKSTLTAIDLLSGRPFIKTKCPTPGELNKVLYRAGYPRGPKRYLFIHYSITKVPIAYTSH